MVSISASLATAKFNQIWTSYHSHNIIHSGVDIREIPLVNFDSRCFILPIEEVCNYFIWRQKDWERNSIHMYAQSFYSHKELMNKSCSDMHEMLYKKDVNWNDLDISLRRGRCCIKKKYQKKTTTRTRWEIDNKIPIFTQKRNYIEKYLKVEK